MRGYQTRSLQYTSSHQTRFFNPTPVRLLNINLTHSLSLSLSVFHLPPKSMGFRMICSKKLQVVKENIFRIYCFTTRKRRFVLNNSQQTYNETHAILSQINSLPTTHRNSKVAYRSLRLTFMDHK